MRAALALLLLLGASPAAAQPRASGPHDGIYEGTRFQECRPGGRVRQERVVAEVRGREMTIPGLPGDPALIATIDANGAVALPGFGVFGRGTGQIFVGRENARRFTGTHPGRGACEVGYDLLRVGPLSRR
jgi:hypothetical protein